ncbi:MAG: RdgB/HAM1 family non-canonical purine NTP pyrophosphatase [Spirochaetota bacterium]
MKKVIIASNNQHKIAEMKVFFADIGISVAAPKEEGISFDVEETGTTFEQNAQLKSEALFKLSGIPSFADDSGICVKALDGRPGVYSARYGQSGMTDKQRAELLVQEMQTQTNRDAYYYCAISYTTAEGSYHFSAQCDGYITSDYDYEAEHGFGYDPIFYYPALQKRFSQVPTNEKNKISHRGLALEKFIQFLKSSN